MGLWIKEPNYSDGNDDITGTVVMLRDSEANNRDGAKTGKGGIILNPQPHDSPNDPLNWPLWRREISLSVVGLYSFIIGGMTPVLAPVMGTLEKAFHKELHTLTFLVGTFMLAMGVGSVFWAPTAILYGKRLIYLTSQGMLFAGFIWAAKAESFGSLLGARILQGLGSAPAESLPSATIAEIFFAHERAYRTGIYTLLLLGGKNLVPLVSGFVASGTGSWHWIFWVLAIIQGGVWVSTFLFVHETWWDRTPIPNDRSVKESEDARAARIKLNRQSWEAVTSPTTNVPLSDDQSSVTATSEQEVEKQKDSRTPFVQNLGIYTSRKIHDYWWQVLLRPFVLYAYPCILFSTFLYGTSVVWLSVIAETISTIFTAEPYNFPTTSVGLLYVGTFVGGCLGSAVAGRASDILVRVMSRRNGGIYEPEFRLVMVLPVLLSVTIGLMGFGWSAQVHDHWIVPTVFLGILGFGTSLASTVSITYAVDSYRVFAAEALVSLNFAKNAMGFAFAAFVPYFFSSSGAKNSFVVYGAIEVGLCLLALPLYRYGKILRHYRDRHNLVAWLYKS